MAAIISRLKSNKNLKDVVETKQPELEVYEADKSDYRIIGLIGKGAFAKVYGAECVSKQRRRVAIKVIKLEEDDFYADEHCQEQEQQLQISDIQQEAAIMSSLRHSNIVSCLCSFVVRDELWLVMPLVSGGSATYILAHSVDDALRHGIKDEEVLCSVLRDTVCGVAYMHRQGRIHRDIKGRNILIDGETGTAMLADFGVSGALLEGGLKKRGRNTMTGTPCWMAPEVMKHQRYNHKADIWSLGITALELAFATTPYTKLGSPMKVMMSIMDGKSPSVEAMQKDSASTSKFSRAFKTFVAKCLVKDAAKRLSAAELLQTEFMKKKRNKQRLVAHIRRIEIKECADADLPPSVRAARKSKPKTYEVTVEEAPTQTLQQAHTQSQAQAQAQAQRDDSADEDEFRYSTTFDKEELQLSGSHEQHEQDEPHEQKGKFTVTKIKHTDTETAAVSVSKKKSRFQVTQVDEDK